MSLIQLPRPHIGQPVWLPSPQGRYRSGVIYVGAAAIGPRISIQEPEIGARHGEQRAIRPTPIPAASEHVLSRLDASFVLVLRVRIVSYDSYYYYISDGTFGAALSPYHFSVGNRLHFYDGTTRDSNVVLPTDRFATVVVRFVPDGLAWFVDGVKTASSGRAASSAQLSYRSAGLAGNAPEQSLLAAFPGEYSDDDCIRISSDVYREIFGRQDVPAMLAGGSPEQPLAATGTATASGSAALTTAIPLSGASASIVSASGALTTSIPLAGSAAVVAVGNGVLTTQITLSGAALAQATAAAALAGGAAALAGAASGASTAGGTLTTGIPLSGNAQALAAAVGSLTVQIRLNGAAVAAAVATGALSTAPSGLAGAASASSAASGLLGTQIRLVGEATATASASGSLGVPILLSGAAAAVSSATGDLTLQLVLEGHSLATALASGTLTAQIQLDGTALAQASALGTLSGAALVTPAARTWRVRSHNRTLRIRA